MRPIGFARRLGLLVLPLLLGGADMPSLVPDVSQREVVIKFSFTGAELLLFGAIVYPDGKMPAKTPDLVVVLKGPEQAVRMREKSKVAGIWVNADSMRFASAPSYYAIASSRPVAQITDERTAAIFELGIRNLQLSPASFSDTAQISRFENGLVDLQSRKRLFIEQKGDVEITGKVLYRARLPLSARAVVGTYTAETFLIQDKRVVAAAVRDIVVRKSSFEQFFAEAADDWPVTYGFAAILLAVGMGWAAGTLGRHI